MLLWLMIFAGTLLFVSGLYFIVKNYRQGIYVKHYGVISYTGFAIAFLGAILLMEPLFTSLPGNLPATAPWTICLFIFIISAQLLLRPTFLKKKRRKKNSFCL